MSPGTCHSTMCMYFLQCCPSYASLLPADPQDVVRLCGKSMNITVQEVGGEELTQHEQSIQRCLQDYRWVLIPCLPLRLVFFPPVFLQLSSHPPSLPPSLFPFSPVHILSPTSLRVSTTLLGNVEHLRPCVPPLVFLLGPPTRLSSRAVPVGIFKTNTCHPTTQEGVAQPGVRRPRQPHDCPLHARRAVQPPPGPGACLSS